MFQPPSVRVYQSEVLDKPSISNIFVPCHVNKGGTIVRLASAVMSYEQCRYYKACLVSDTVPDVSD